MAGFSHNTAAGAGLGVVGIVPQRSIPIDVESVLWRKQTKTCFECLT